MSELSPSYARLRWQCRRGMLELDVLLLDFLEREYARLSPAEQFGFQSLLSCPDQELHGFFFGGQSPGDPALVRVVARIRDAFSH